MPVPSLVPFSFRAHALCYIVSIEKKSIAAVGTCSVAIHNHGHQGRIAMYRILGSAEPANWHNSQLKGLHSRARELERMLEIGAYDLKIQQHEAEVQALRQKKALLESELGRLRNRLSELGERSAGQAH